MSEIVEALRDLSLFAQEGGGLGFFPDIALMLNMFVGGVTLRVQSGRGDHDIFYVCLTLALVLLSLFLGIYAPLDLRLILLGGVAFANIMMWVTYKDPTPADDRAREAEERAREAEARVRREEARNRQQLEAALRTETELERLRARVADELSDDTAIADPDVIPITEDWIDEELPEVRDYSNDARLAAGTPVFADTESIPNRVRFPRKWLRSKRLRAKDVFLVRVSGDSMEPELCDGDRVLVDETRCAPRSGWIYALRTAEGPVVKRLRKRKHRWWAVSDNEKYEPQPLDDRARIMGRVVWWAHTD